MENLTATFSKSDDMIQAADALRKQGAINIQMLSGPLEPEYSFTNHDDSFLPASPEHGQNEGLLQVLVESSRRKQAEDTISRYGGQL